MSTVNFPLTTTTLFVNTLNTTKTIYLPAASTVNAGRLFYIKDINGNAALSTIYISTIGLDRLENRSSVYASMSTNYGSVLIAPDGYLNWYFLQHYYKNAIKGISLTGSATISFTPTSITGLALWLDASDTTTVFSTFSFNQSLTTSSQQVSISGVTSLSGWLFVSATMGGSSINSGTPVSATIVPSATAGIWYSWCRDAGYTKVVKLQYTLTSGNLYVIALDGAYTTDLTLFSTLNTGAQNDTQYNGAGLTYGAYGAYTLATHSFQVPTTGTSVSQWSDKSGNGNNLTQGTTSAQPTSGTYLSYPGIYFNGANTQTLSTTYIQLGTGGRTTFIVFYDVNTTPDIYGNPGLMYMGGTAAAGSGWRQQHIATANALSIDAGSSVKIMTTSPNVTSMRTTRCIGAWGAPTGATMNSCYVYGNGTQFTIQDGNSGGLTQAINTAGSGTVIGYSTSVISEVLHFSTELTTTQRQQVEGYLAWKWGIQASLPSTHPYKSAAPTATTFTPTSIASLKMWFDATDATTLALSSGSVTQWTDKSGTGNTLTPWSGQANATVSSAYQNGLNVLNFSGNSLYRSPLGSAVYPQDVYIILAMKSVSAHNDVLGMGDTQSDNFNSLTLGEYTTKRWHNGSSGFNRTPNCVSPSDEISTSFLLIQWSIANSNFLIRRNGTQLVQTSSYTYSFGTPSTSIFQIGYRHTNITGSANFNGYIGEILVFNSQLGTTDRQTVEGYLAAKWGLQSSLPTGHPYKSATPTSAIGTPIATGLRYQFDAAKNLPTTSGWTDANGYGNLTFYNSPPVTTGNVNYVSFNGTSQYGASVDMTNLTAFTITMWIRTTSTTNNSTYYLKPHLIGEGSGGIASRDFGLTIGGGYAGIWSGIGSTDTQNQSETNTSAANYIANGLWYELTVTSSYTNGTRLYVNATQFGSALTASQATESGQNWNIAATNYLAGGPNCWAALDLSVVLLYTRELSATEVTANFNSYRARFGR